jgi:tripartite-type tricarboxylate transporter receptor subunit TctC
MIAVTGLKRSLAVPELAAIAESGVPGYQFTAWSALHVPSGTAKPIMILNREVVKLLNRPDVKERLTPLGYDIEASTPHELRDYIGKERATYAQLMRMTGWTSLSNQLSHTTRDLIFIDARKRTRARRWTARSFFSRRGSRCR